MTDPHSRIIFVLLLATSSCVGGSTLPYPEEEAIPDLGPGPAFLDAGPRKLSWTDLRRADLQRADLHRVESSPPKSLALFRLSSTDPTKGTQGNPWRVGDTTTLGVTVSNIDPATEQVTYTSGRVGTAGSAAQWTIFSLGAVCSGPSTCSTTGVWSVAYLCEDGPGIYQQFDRVALLSDPAVSHSITWWSACE